MLWIISVTVIILMTVAMSHEECQGNNISCYACDSWIEPRCSDPFNWSSSLDDLKIECRGCCVKIVNNAKSPYESVRRTCTTEFSNLQCVFFLDYSCSGSLESKKRGSNLCFCEENDCNNATSLYISPLLVTTILACYSQM